MADNIGADAKKKAINRFILNWMYQSNCKIFMTQASITLATWCHCIKSLQEKKKNKKHENNNSIYKKKI